MYIIRVKSRIYGLVSGFSAKVVFMAWSVFPTSPQVHVLRAFLQPTRVDIRSIN